MALVLAGLLAGGLLPACAGAPAPDASDVAAVTPSPGSVALVDPASFAATIDEPGVTVIDVRTPQEFAAGHIGSAIDIDVEDPTTFVSKLSALDPNATYAVYCRSGNRSATATQYMANEGFTSIVELDGGITAWQQEGFPVVR